MTTPQLLGQLAATHQMLTGLIESTPETDCHRSFHPQLAPLAWYLGLCVYLETYWLREVIQGDDDLTGRVRHLFTHQSLPTQEQWSRLPPKDHLLNWALEIQDENLTRLANPRLLPDHHLLRQDRVLHHILQHHHRIYETMLMALTQRQLQHLEDNTYRAVQPLASHPPILETISVPQGHYRIGAKEPASCYDNELPAQMVELSGFRISRSPVTNAEFLGFMQDGGYESRGLWTDQGWQWLQQAGVSHPSRWRRDDSGNWYDMGLNGPSDLIADEPVMGINQHEAQAYALWVAGQGDEHSGAVLQHEYQWEVAVRTQGLQEFGKVWEWCANPFHPYAGFEPSRDGALSHNTFGDGQFSLRGFSIYTQTSLRRPSFRNNSPASHRHIFAGVRLVYPPIN